MNVLRLLPAVKTRHDKNSQFLLSLLCVVLTGLLGIAVSQPASAQLVTSEEKGLPSNGAFSGGDIDTVNVQNGNLHISIPIASAKQRGGGTLNWSLVYDTQGWIKTYYPNTECTNGTKICNPPGYYTGETNLAIAGGWRFTNPYAWTVSSTHLTGVTCASEPTLPYSEYTNWIVTDPQGTNHTLPLHWDLLSTSTTTTGTCLGNTLEGPTLDGSGMVFNSKAASSTSGTLYLKDGTQIPMTGQAGYFVGSTRIDANGNEAGPNDTLNRQVVTQGTGPTVTYTSPLGKQQSGTQYTRYTVQDANGSSRVYQLNYELIDIDSNICSQGVTLSGDTCSAAWSDVLLVPSSLNLPTGRSYSFSYYNNSDGEIESITLPTGGVITYAYKDLYQTKQPTVSGQQGNVVGGRSVTSRTETVSGSTYTWTYGITLGGTNTVTDPLGNVTTHVFQEVEVPVGSSYVYTSNNYETSTKYANSAGAVLRTITNAYSAEYDPVNNGVANARVTSQTTTLDNGQESQKQTTYETFTYSCYTSSYCPATATRMNPTEVREYDYGSGAPGALLRRTDYAYLHASNATYATLNIVDKPTSIIVYNGSSAMVSETEMEYDNYSHSGQAMEASGAVQHSSSYGTTYTTRGNLTAVSKWRNTDGALLATTNQFDDAGNVLSTVDPLGHQTSFSYADSWANSTCAPSGSSAAFLTKTTNALGQTTSSTYESCTGQAATTIDVNKQPTATSFDLAGRVASVSYPDGGETSYCYSDDESGSCASSSTNTVTATKKISASSTAQTITTYDGLGRLIQNEVASDPDGATYTTTSYDGLNRVSSVSNPFRTGNTQYATTYSYDGIGRELSASMADGSTSSTSYSGNTTTVTDEAGHKRETQADALGRTTAVFEDPSGVKYETDYTYDALGNVLQATQKGGSTTSSVWRTRTFTFNSLNQLLCSSNPEIGSVAATCPATDSGSYIAGTIRYQYDNAGNLISKISPLANQTGSSTENTSINYDALNRVTSVLYGDNHTPNLYYAYDVAPAWMPSLQNVVGRLTNTNNGYGGSTSGLATATTYSYDQMGRIVQQWEQTPSVSAGGEFIYNSYDLAGDLISTQAASGTTLHYTYDGAQRISSVISNLNDAQHPETLYAVDSTAGYYPDGSLHKATFGNGLTEAFALNARNQVCRTDLNSGGATLSSCTDSTPSGSVLDFTLGYNAGASDNGNLASWVATGQQTFNRTYGYDSLNRLQTMTDSASAQTCKGLSWTIDAWGNVSAQNVTSGSCFNFSTSAGTNNRLASYQYDAAGNVSSDGSHTYVYDAEGRVLEVDGGTTASYVYNENGQRVRKNTSSGWTEYFYGPNGQVQSEFNGSSFPAEYAYAGSRLIAIYTNGTTEFVHPDHLGSTRLLTSVTKGVLDNMDYDPYGAQIAGGATTTHKFTGKERDAESGLDFFGARYYASSVGRFMSPDWAEKATAVPYADFNDPQTLNLYSYVQNGPLNRVDADGHAATDSGDKALPSFVNLCPDGESQGCAQVWNVDILGLGTPYSAQTVSIGDTESTISASFNAPTAATAQQIHVETTITVHANSHWWNRIGDWFSSKSSAFSAVISRSLGSFGGDRAGKPFTRGGKQEVLRQNAAKYGGQTTCESCNQPTIPAQQSQSGVSRPGNESSVDHIHPQSKLGDGSPINGQNLCATCNGIKSDSIPIMEEPGVLPEIPIGIP